MGSTGKWLGFRFTWLATRTVYFGLKPSRVMSRCAMGLECFCCCRSLPAVLCLLAELIRSPVEKSISETIVTGICTFLLTLPLKTVASGISNRTVFQIMGVFGKAHWKTLDTFFYAIIGNRHRANETLGT